MHWQSIWTFQFSTILISPPKPPPSPTNAKGNHLYVLTLLFYYTTCYVYKVDGVDICHTIVQQRVIYLITNVPIRFSVQINWTLLIEARIIGLGCGTLVCGGTSSFVVIGIFICNFMNDFIKVDCFLVWDLLAYIHDPSCP